MTLQSGGHEGIGQQTGQLSTAERSRWVPVRRCARGRMPGLDFVPFGLGVEPRRRLPIIRILEEDGADLKNFEPLGKRPGEVVVELAVAFDGLVRDGYEEGTANIRVEMHSKGGEFRAWRGRS